MIHAAAHGQLLHPTAHRHVHPLHLNHPLRARPERRPGLVPRLPRDARQHSRPHRRETRRNTLPPHVDSRQPVPAGSVPPSPGFQPISHLSGSHVQPRPHALDDPTHSSPGSSITGIGPGAAVSAAVLPGQNMSGRLTGVVSLTDVLNLFARASGLSPKDPEEERQRRRRSSSSSLRPSMDSLRSSIDLGRSSSTSGGRR